MSNWKSKAPPELSVPSSPDAIDHFFSHNHKLPQSVVSSVFSPAGAQQFPTLTPDSLLSPVDPGFLDGASSRARFGLDIGGTLCKVVYFEPAPEEAELTDGSGVGQQSRDTRSADLFKKSNDKVRKGCSGNGADRKASSILRVKEGNATKLITGGADQLTISTETCITTGGTPSPKVQNAADVHTTGHRLEKNGKEGGNNRRTTDAALESCQCSCGTPGRLGPDSLKEVMRAPGGNGGADDQYSRRQAKKIWVSSYEPVHLAGRGTLYFKCFETWRMEEFLNLTKEYHLMTGGRAIGATGGGARKFGDQFLEIAGLQLQRADELKSLIRGIDFLARHAHQESFEYPTGSYQGGSIQRPWKSPENSSDGSADISSEDEFSLFPCGEETELGIPSPTAAAATSEVGQAERHRRAQNAKGPPALKGPVLDSGVWIGSSEPLHPYLVVNIGSGVSILRVDSPDKFERVGGTSLGGSTFLGLAKALTGCQSFEEAITLAMRGDSTNVDMLVGDIFGGDYTEMGLAATTVAGSFGKLVQPERNVESQQPQHLAKAALLMVTNNIGSIAWLHARNSGVRSMMFTGSFLHNNKLAIRLLAVAMEFWSKGSMKAVFLRHEGHAGAIGALLSALESSNPLDALLPT